MKKQTFYANGDSFVYGMEILGDQDDSPENKDLSFSKSMSRAMNSTHYINNAYCGATNEFIFRKTLRDLTLMLDQGQDPGELFVLVGITSLYRIEVVGRGLKSYVGPEFNSLRAEYRDFGTLFFNPKNKMRIDVGRRSVALDELIVPWATQFLWDDDLLLEQQWARFTGLKSFLDLNHIDHLFVNTTQSVDKLEQTSSAFGTNSIYGLDQSFAQWGRVNYPDQVRQASHFGPAVHQVYGQVLMDHLASR